MARDKHEKDPELVALGQRVRARRYEMHDRAGLSVDDICRAMSERGNASFANKDGSPRHQPYYDTENGKRELSAKEIQDLAEILDSTPEKLLGLPPRRRQVSLLGEVGRGGEYCFSARWGRWMEIEKINAPLGDEEVNAALRVVGDDLRPFGYWDGDVLYFRYPGDDLAGIAGKRCIVQIRNGTAYVGLLQPGATRGRYRLQVFGGATLPDIEIEWAARIRWHEQG